MHHITKHLLDIEYSCSHHFSNGELIENSIEVNVTRLEKADDSLQLCLSWFSFSSFEFEWCCINENIITRFVFLSGLSGEINLRLKWRKKFRDENPYLFNMDETIGNHSTHSTFTPRPELVNGMISSLLIVNWIDLPRTSTAKWYSQIFHSRYNRYNRYVFLCFRKKITTHSCYHHQNQFSHVKWALRIRWRDHNVQPMSMSGSAYYVPGSLFRERSHCDFRKFTGWGWQRSHYCEQMKCVFGVIMGVVNSEFSPIE